MKLKRMCEFCNKEFEVVLSKSRIASGNHGRFCNLDCYHNWQKWNAKHKTEKKCSLCHEVKPIFEFYKNKHCIDGYNCSCKDCSKKAANDYYQRNKDVKREHFRSIKRKSLSKALEEWRRVIISKFGLKCPDCGIEGPFCIFDLHHVDPKGKEFQMAKFRKVTEEGMRELDKCILLCSNCHRIRHWGGGSNR